MTEGQARYLYEINRKLAWEEESDDKKEALENIDAIIRAKDGTRAWKTIDLYVREGLEGIINNAYKL